MAELDGHAPHATGGADDIIPRDIRFGILENAQRHWLEGDIIKTVLIDGLSIFLPEGERFFIRSLKHYGPKLQDRELAAEINGYTATKHQREVGTGYFDAVSMAITGGQSSTTAMHESTEHEQFRPAAE